MKIGLREVLHNFVISRFHYVAIEIHDDDRFLFRLFSKRKNRDKQSGFHLQLTSFGHQFRTQLAENEST